MGYGKAGQGKGKATHGQLGRAGQGRANGAYVRGTLEAAEQRP